MSSGRNGGPLPPRPACGEGGGERGGGGGSLHRFVLADSPPHPDCTGRCFASPRQSDLSLQAGRGAPNIRTDLNSKQLRSTARASTSLQHLSKKDVDGRDEA